MTTPWLYDENSQFYTKICDFWLLRTWFMAQDDSALKRTKKNWSVQHDAEKDVATIEKLANYLGASCFFTCWHSNTADGIGEPQSPRVYNIYIYPMYLKKNTYICGYVHRISDYSVVPMIIQLLGSPMVAAPLRAQSKLRFCSIYPPLPWRHPPPGLFQRSFAAVPFELFSYAGAFYLFGEQDLYHSDPWRRHFSHLPNDAVEVPVDLGSQTWSTKRPTNGFWRLSLLLYVDTSD